eukprot:SAG22_NODE_7813_length_705_cov_1.364686_1_plen_53_part_01
MKQLSDLGLTVLDLGTASCKTPITRGQPRRAQPPAGVQHYQALHRHLVAHASG